MKGRPLTGVGLLIVPRAISQDRSIACQVGEGSLEDVPIPRHSSRNGLHEALLHRHHPPRVGVGGWWHRPSVNMAKTPYKPPARGATHNLGLSSWVLTQLVGDCGSPWWWHVAPCPSGLISGPERRLALSPQALSRRKKWTLVREVGQPSP